MRVALIPALLILAVAVAACAQAGPGGSGPQYTVTMTEFKFEPANLTVPRGQKVVVKIENKGAVQHDWNVPDLNVQSPKVQPGQSATVEFTPDKAGTFKVVCVEPGHEQAGMVGQLTVQ